MNENLIKPMARRIGSYLAGGLTFGYMTLPTGENAEMLYSAIILVLVDLWHSKISRETY